MSFFSSSFTKIITPNDKKTSFQISKGTTNNVVEIKGESTKKDNDFVVHKNIKKRNVSGKLVSSSSNTYKLKEDQLKNMIEHSLKDTFKPPQIVDTPKKKKEDVSKGKVKKLTVKSASKPVSKPASKPVSKSASKPASKPVSKSASKPVSKKDMK